MRILITKHFAKWAKKNSLKHETLKQAAEEIINSNVDAELGSFLFKKRIGIQNRGKRGGVRAIVFYQINNTVIFIHGFLKSEKDNLSVKEFKAFKSIANIFLTMTQSQFEIAIKNGDFVEL